MIDLANTFLNPERLWWLLAIPVLVAAYVWALRRKSRTGMRFTNTAVLAAVVPQQSAWRRHLAVAMALLSLGAIIAAWARPNGIERVPRERATIVLIVDASQSMNATDVKPTRLQAAKDLSKKFVQSLPAKYNLALVSLTGNPAVKLPPSLDRTVALRAIDALTVGDGTNLAGALQVAGVAIDTAPRGDDGSPAPGAVVLLSDGVPTSSTSQSQSPLQAAEELKKKNIPVFTIAYGTENGSVDLDGRRWQVPPDPQTMSSIAKITGGTFSTAENAGELDRVYGNLRSEVGYEEVKKEVTALWAGYSLAFAVVAALAAVSLGARWP